MSVGGILQRGNKKEAGGGGGGITGAVNGLSASGANAVLGQDWGAVGNPAALLSSREIPLGGFVFRMKSAGPQDNLIIADTAWLLAENLGGSQIDGNIGTLTMKGPQGSYITDGTNQWLAVSPSAHDVQIGDVSLNFNKNIIDIDDSAEQILIGSIPNSNFVILSTSLGAEDFEVNFGTAYLIVNKSTGLYQLGDTAISDNGTLLSINDTTGVATIRTDNKFQITDTGNFQFLTVETPNAAVAIGDVDSKINGTKLSISDSTKTLLYSIGADYFLKIDASNKVSHLLAGDPSFTVQVADIYLDGVNGNVAISGQDAMANQVKIFLDSGALQAQINAASGLKITGDTTLLHTGTALANGAGGSAGTLTNAPAAGNPTKWIPIDDNGTTRYIPAW